MDHTDYGAVTTQPGQISGQGDSNLRPHSGPIRGLNAILENIQDLTIHQHLDAFEVCMGWERNNRYSIYTTGREQILYVYEAAQCYARQCYGSLRELSLVMTDNDDNRLLQLYRPLRCSSRCCYACCHLQEMTISLPSKEPIGDIHEKWSCCTPHYEILDEEEKLRYIVEGSVCHLRCCGRICFNISTTSGDHVSSIRSKWGGCPGVIGAFNEYTITYASELSSVDKIRIMATSFLLDFNYFQRHGKCF